ncbi:LytTR family transcriptional regulator [Parvularcula marina]|uniref:LytTR family transcriptional regulator n=2 Tax=Parvularcula marina TaxID=2292771 RepID=A0A371RID3_9PROT|nr:LytTR family transcriptional regulator [Parvularcula marina]
MIGRLIKAMKRPSEEAGDPRAIDRRADWSAFLWFAIFGIAGQIIAVWSYATELDRAGDGSPVSRVMLWEFSSIFVILALFPLVRWIVSQATPGQHDWKRLVLFHVLGVIVYSGLHIFFFVILRKIGHALFWGEHYIFTDNPLRELTYEFRKDVMTYALIVVFIVLARQFEQMRADLATARRDAAATRQLSVKSGGRTLYVTIEDILTANSSGNYVELKTSVRTVTIRTTLSALSDQVAAAGGEAVRVHRSWLVNPKAMVELKPTGSGDAVAVMQNGDEVPVSRRFRDRLEAPATP